MAEREREKEEIRKKREWQCGGDTPVPSPILNSIPLLCLKVSRKMASTKGGTGSTVCAGAPPELAQCVEL